jgi:hypothetical protein
LICKILNNINLKVTFTCETIHILLFIQKFANTKKIQKSLDLDNVTPSSGHKNCGNSEPAAEILAYSSELEALVELMKPQNKGLGKVQLGLKRRGLLISVIPKRIWTFKCSQ